MRTLARFVYASFLLFLPFEGFTQGASAVVPGAIKCALEAQRIDEERFISIGGIEQWVTISGADCANPVILFLHGGPGNPLSPFAKQLYGAWEKDFTLVQWDQRGAGRTFGRNFATAEAALTIERMTQDGIEVTAYLTRHLGKRKVILFGGSWSSVLGVHMAKSRPDLFYAYVGTGQLVHYAENRDSSVHRLLALARGAGDTKTVMAIEALGTMPWTNPRNFGIFRKATRVYEAKTTTPAPKSWWMPAPLYATPKAQEDYEAGEDYSYIQFVGLKGDGMYSRIDLPKLGTTFDIPVFLLQGSEDLVTTPEVARRYFDTIVAPRKDYVLLPRVGHDPNQAMIDAQYHILKTRVVPLVKAGNG